MDESTAIVISVIIGLSAGALLGFLAGWFLHDLAGKEAEFGSINVIRDDKGYPISYEVLPIGKILKR